MAPHDERIAAFGKRLPEELEDGRDRSLRNQCGRQGGDRAADSISVEWWLPQQGAFSDSPAPAASALCWQWWQQTCDDIVTHLHESDTYAGPPHAVR